MISKHISGCQQNIGGYNYRGSWYYKGAADEVQTAARVEQRKKGPRQKGNGENGFILQQLYIKRGNAFPISN